MLRLTFADWLAATAMFGGRRCRSFDAACDVSFSCDASAGVVRTERLLRWQASSPACSSSVLLVFSSDLSCDLFGDGSSWRVLNGRVGGCVMET